MVELQSQKVDKKDKPRVKSGDLLDKKKTIRSTSTYERYSTFNGIADGLYNEPKNKGFVTVVDSVEKKEEDSYKNFLNYIVAIYKIKDPKIVARLAKDGEIKSLYLELVEQKQLKEKDFERIEQLKKKLSLKILSYLPREEIRSVKTTNKPFMYVNNFFFINRVQIFRDQILATKNEKAIKVWRDGLAQLRKEIQAGKIKTSDQFTKRLFEVFDAAIKASNDEKLQTAWNKYKKTKEAKGVDFAYSALGDADEIKPQKAKDKPIKKKKESEKALQQATNQVSGIPGLDIESGDAGKAKVIVNGEFSVSMSLFRNSENGKYYYYLDDEYRNGPPMRVEADKILPTLWDRQLDAEATEQLAMHKEFASEVSKVPDKDLIRLMKKILGSGQKNGFEIKSKARKVITAIVKVLKGEDSKYSSLQKKMEVLDTNLNTSSKCQYAKRILEEKQNDFANVSAFIAVIKKAE